MKRFMGSGIYDTTSWKDLGLRLQIGEEVVVKEFKDCLDAIVSGDAIGKYILGIPYIGIGFNLRRFVEFEEKDYNEFFGKLYNGNKEVLNEFAEYLKCCGIDYEETYSWMLIS